MYVYLHSSLLEKSAQALFSLLYLIGMLVVMSSALASLSGTGTALILNPIIHGCVIATHVVQTSGGHVCFE